MYSLLTGSRSPWSVFDELESLQRDFNRAFGANWPARARRRSYPPFNVWSGKEGLIVDAEVPGVDPKDLNVSVSGDELTLQGKVGAEGAREGETVHREERRSGEFVRVLQLPFRAKESDIRANYKNGILRITVPRPEEEKPKKIAIEAA